MMQPSILNLRRSISAHSRLGRCPTAVPRLTLLRSDRPTVPVGTIYQPVLCVIAQGRKRVILGEKLFEYDAAKYLISSVDLPVTGEICEATPTHPYLALSLALDPAILASLLLDMAREGPDSDVPAALAVRALTPDLLDPVVRLLALLDRPRDIAMLGPMVEREILYRLLCGPDGAVLRQIALADSRLSRINRAIAWIRANFAKPLRIETLAEVAGMSASSFHRHFKAVTLMSPLQYQKQIRLQEARRLLLAQQQNATGIGFAVGYESPSQFSREYSRMFGVPPTRDAARLRELSMTGALPFSHPL